MEYTHLGRAGAVVSRLCLGTMNFGPQTTEPDSHEIMDRALDAGINFFDTANAYGWRLGEGVTEQIIGRWFAQGGGRREKTVIATKLYGRMMDWPNGDRLSAISIMRECEGSLRRLQTDHIDLLQMHHVDRETPWDEIWQAMETLVRQGKVLYVGSSNFAGWHIAQACESARRRNFMGLVSEQSLYNLAKREVELEVIPAAQGYGVGVMCYSPLWGGVLGGMLGKQPVGGRRSSDMANKRLKPLREKVERYEGFCAELGVDPGEVGVAWLLHRPGVTAPIIGPRHLEQLESALRAVEVSLGEGEMKRLDAIFPGPGGPAPEAYAW